MISPAAILQINFNLIVNRKIKTTILRIVTDNLIVLIEYKFLWRCFEFLWGLECQEKAHAISIFSAQALSA